ncbi:hypothetical protein WG66_000696 [Moniliophthora roreri]|uniref:Uncharacterized protein n=1 Tax=Moniliophthora roreri TaxID=221103 RepID=A0A0W0FLN7_MONRR|nr:hypothetical protein WG66_000696 [Moniliophthora roreri]
MLPGNHRMLSGPNDSLASLPTTSGRSLFSKTDTDATSFGTLTGPGSLAGKAIYKLGKATIKGVEQIIISRRLFVISNHFPHENRAEIHGIQQMYADLLELSRKSMYIKSIRNQALRILLRQIGVRHTNYLLQSLSTWPKVELKLLVSDILAIFDPFLPRSQLKNAYLHDPILQSYRTHVPKWDDHFLLPLVDFLDQVALINEDRCIAILESGTLDFMLHLYLTGFHDPAPSAGRTNATGSSALLSACNAFLVTAQQNTFGAELIRLHEISSIWSVHPVLAFHDSKGDWSTREQFWRKADRTAIKWRISSIFDLMMDVKRNLNLDTAFNALVDCFELISSRYDDDIVYRALRSLHRAIIRNPEASGQYVVGRAMAAYLSASPEGYIFDTLNRVVELAGLMSTGSTFRLFGFEDDGPTFTLDAVIHFIEWITSISESDEDHRRIVLATNIVHLAEQTLEDLDESFFDDTVSFKDLVNDYWKEKDVELYCAVYGPDSLNAPIHVHVLRWSLIVLKDQIEGRRFRILSLPDDWWHSDHITDVDLVYDWIYNE